MKFSNIPTYAVVDARTLKKVADNIPSRKKAWSIAVACCYEQSNWNYVVAEESNQKNA